MPELNFKPFQSLQTPRLILRALEFADAPDVLALRSNEQAMQYIPRTRAVTLADAEAHILLLLDALKNENGVNWAICLKETPNKVIGIGGFVRLQKEHFRAEIGYMLHPNFWGKGYMTEAVKAIEEFGFREIKFHSIEAYIDPRNTASEQVLLKSGYTKEAHFKENFFFNNEFTDTVVYSKINPY